MIAYNVNANKKNAYIVTAFLYLTSIICFMFTAIDIQFKLFLQLLAISIALIAIQLTVRFVSCDISYAIDERQPMSLKIFKVQNKNSRLFGGVLLQYIYKIEKVNLKEKAPKSEEKTKNISTLNYCGTLFASEYYVIYCRDELEDKCIKLEINDAFAKEIEMRINLSSDSYTEE